MPSPSPGNILLMLAALLISGWCRHASNLAQGSLLTAPDLPPLSDMSHLSLSAEKSRPFLILTHVYIYGGALYKSPSLHAHNVLT